tara:strand:+ start:128 stop:802 length:675 start_codon:yes stop_codon:yes gene_type:complete
MHLSKDKKILIYLFLLIFLGSINNTNFANTQIFEIKNLNLYGLNEKEKSNLLEELEQIKNQNIFSLPNKKLVEILSSDHSIESFYIQKNYPSNLDIFVKKTSFLANIIINDENFLIGTNKKLIKSQSIYSNLPTVQGNPTIKEFFSIKNDILKSSVSFEEIEKLHFFPSKRWDLKLNNGVLVKLPFSNTLEALDNFFEIKDLPQFEKVKIFDMRIKGQIIINEF